jgi:phage recombination protein Bet
MTTALAHRDDHAPLAIQPGQEMWTDKQKAALAVLGITGASNADLAVFMHYCQKTQLDPFSRQIYYIKRRERAGDQWTDKWTIQVGIDGFRVMRDRVAERTGCQVEFEDTLWYDGDGMAYAVWLTAEPPAACQVVLVKYQDGRKLRFPAVLRTAAYAQVNNKGELVSQWRTQADHMIEKCCEAFATRRAFPNDFAGIYLEDELNGRQPAPPPVRKVTAAEIIRGEPEPQPQPERPRRPGKTELAAKDRLLRLTEQLPLSPPETRDQDWQDILTWLAGDTYTAAPAQIKTIVPQLEEFLTKAGGDPEKAVTDLWTAYETAQKDTAND